MVLPANDRERRFAGRTDATDFIGDPLGRICDHRARDLSRGASRLRSLAGGIGWGSQCRPLHTSDPPPRIPPSLPRHTGPGQDTLQPYSGLHACVLPRKARVLPYIQHCPKPTPRNWFPHWLTYLWAPLQPSTWLHPKSYPRIQDQPGSYPSCLVLGYSAASPHWGTDNSPNLGVWKGTSVTTPRPAPGEVTFRVA